MVHAEYLSVSVQKSTWPDTLFPLSPNGDLSRLGDLRQTPFGSSYPTRPLA